MRKPKKTPGDVSPEQHGAPYLGLPFRTTSDHPTGVMRVDRVGSPEAGIKLFISHASEDKNALAQPLAEALIQAGYRVWYDDFSLVAGDSIKEQIDRGLASCDYAIVILSKAFFSKHWPKEELDGLAALESVRGARVIIPIWHQITFREITQHSPSLAGKKGIESSGGLTALVRAITAAVNRENVERYIRRRDLTELSLQLNCAAAVLDAGIPAIRAHLLKKPDVSWTEFGKELFEKLRKMDEQEQNPNQG